MAQADRAGLHGLSATLRVELHRPGTGEAGGQVPMVGGQGGHGIVFIVGSWTICLLHLLSSLNDGDETFVVEEEIVLKMKDCGNSFWFKVPFNTCWRPLH